MSDKLNILIVDDIFINHVILESILIELGHRVESAKTGLAAVKTVKKQNFDLILMDINMPEMENFTFRMEPKKIWHRAGMLMKTQRRRLNFWAISLRKLVVRI